jgi:hypothetical protein
MFGCDRFESQSRGVLKDAFRAGVMDKLVAADQALLHRNAAPGAEPVWEVGRGGVLRRSHGGHCLRGLRTLSTESAGTRRRSRSENILPAGRASF